VTGLILGGETLPISSFQNRLFDWSQESISKVQARKGIYEFYDSLEMVIFVGASQNVLETLQHYYDTGFSDNPCLRDATNFRVEYVDNPEWSLKEHIHVHKSTSGGTMPECMK
jgi:hypothetical protein